MRLLSFRHEGRESWGVAVEDGVVDLGRRLGATYPTLKALVETGSLEPARKAAVGLAADYPLKAISFLPPVVDPGKVLCVGINYLKVHPTSGKVERPANPSIFIKLPNALVGHGQNLVKPSVSEQFDYEGELAFVIGKAGRNIPEEKAFEHIIGYTCLNDGSVRDWQGHSVAAGKNFEASGACGPWLVPAEEVGPVDKLELSTRINGERVQNTTVDLMMFSIPYMVHYLSTMTTLMPGDIVSTGTPEGSGAKRDPVRFLRPGDVLEVEWTGIGTLRNPVVAGD